MEERLTKRIDNKTYFIIKTEGNDFYSDGEDLTFNYYDKEVQEAINRLAEYEDLEEQGLIVRLPCKVGDKVYHIYNSGYYQSFTGASRKAKHKYIVDEETVYGFELDNDGLGWRIRLNGSQPVISLFGDRLFFTRVEAEKKLKELEGEE